MNGKIVGWMAYCEKTGGRLFQHTEDRAREHGARIYSEYGFVVLPLVVAPEDQQSRNTSNVSASKSAVEQDRGAS